MDKILQQLTERLTKTFGDRLVAVILYGSAASGDYHGDFSDLNVLCVLTQVTTTELQDSEAIFHWWRQQGNPSPLLLSEEEVRTSTDCFPIEFWDMKERRRVLSGKDVIEPLVIDESFYRAQVEHELRAKLLRLRQKAAGVIFDNELLCRLMADSIATMLVLTRHALRLCGFSAPGSRTEIVEEAARSMGVDAGPLTELLELRSKKKQAKQVASRQLLERYIAQIGIIIQHVDGIAK